MKNNKLLVSLRYLVRITLMKKFLFICICLAFISSPLAANESQYSQVIDDLPLMQGMVENKEKSVVFEKPQGRIVEAFAIIKAKKSTIETFYKQSLPALGWKHHKRLIFSREGEQLTISIAKTGQRHEIRFSLKPKI